MAKETSTSILVSISCITYNHAPYIRQCLDGFLMQQTEFAFEVLIHDDCSTDGTTEIIKEYEAKYPDIIKPIYEDENQYQQGKPAGSAVWNFPRAKGKYIAMCEGDDYWVDPLKLQKQVDFMEANPDYSLCGTNGLVKYEGIKKDDKLFNNLIVSRELLPQDIIGHWIFPTASLLFKKDVCMDYPKWTEKVYSGDQVLMLLSLNMGRVYAFSDVSCVYRRDVASKSSLSMTIRRTKSRAYVITQNIILYEQFYKYTGRKYEKHIIPLLNDLHQREKAYKMMDRSVLLAALRYPLAFLRILRLRKNNK